MPILVLWSSFQGANREVFRTKLGLDEGTWARGRAWTLWKALVVAADFMNPKNIESSQCWRIIDEVIADHLNWRKKNG